MFKGYQRRHTIRISSRVEKTQDPSGDLEKPEGTLRFPQLISKGEKDYQLSHIPGRSFGSQGVKSLKLL
jgi:hypothetical protein